MKKIAFVSLLALAGLYSCQHHPIVYTNPEVDITAPEAAGIYFNGDTVHIEMTLSDEEALHEAYIYIRSDVDSFFTYEPYVHELQSFDVDTFWVVTGMTTGVSAFVTGVAHNHHDGVTILNVPITLIP